jgi:hypothetical protein
MLSPNLTGRLQMTMTPFQPIPKGHQAKGLLRTKVTKGLSSFPYSGREWIEPLSGEDHYDVFVLFRGAGS